MTTQPLMVLPAPRSIRRLSLPRRAALALAATIARLALQRSEPASLAARDDAERRLEQARDRWLDLTPLR